MDLTVAVAPLAAAAALLTRLLTGRSPQPAHAAVVLRADATGLRLDAGDGEVTVHLHTPATVHTEGEATMPRRALCDTITALDAPSARLTLRAGRLAIRVPGGRFALP